MRLAVSQRQAHAALDRAGIPWRIAFTSPSLAGIWAAAAAGLGIVLEEPFLQLAFLCLPVIPHLKITDHGMVDVDRFEVMP